MAWRSFLPNPARRARWDTLDLGFLTLDLSYSSPALLCYVKNIFSSFLSFFFFFYNVLQVSNCLVFLCLTDKEHVSPRISLTSVATLNYLLMS